MSKLNQNIYSARRKAGLTMEELGNKVGVSKVTIKKYESGDIKNIPSDKIEKIASATGVSEIDLMGWVDTIYKDNPSSVIKAKILALLDELNTDDLEFVYNFVLRIAKKDGN